MATKKAKTAKKTKKIKKITKKSCCCGDGKACEKRLDLLREKIMNTSWHHLQTESTIKQFFCELIDTIKTR